MISGPKSTISTAFTRRLSTAYQFQEGDDRVVVVRRLSFFLTLAAIVAFAAMEKRQSPVQEFPRGAIVPVQSRNVHDLAPGRLLVATRSVADPNFSKTVVLLIRYEEKSIAGLILNRRTNVPLSRLSEGLSGHLYIGGPVEPNLSYALLKAPDKLEGAEHIFDGVHLITSKTLFEQTIATQPDPRTFHMYQGSAEWIPEQLEREVARGSWVIFPANAEAVFTEDPDSLWFQMIRKTELKIAANETKGDGRKQQMCFINRIIDGAAGRVPANPHIAGFRYEVRSERPLTAIR